MPTPIAPGHILVSSNSETTGIWASGGEVRVIVAPDLRSMQGLFAALDFLDPMTGVGIRDGN